MADSIILLEERKEVTTFLLDEGTITATTVTTPTGETPGYEYAGNKVKVDDAVTLSAASDIGKPTVKKYTAAEGEIILGIAVNDPVTLIGTDGAERITMEQIADAADSFNYEFTCGISRRVCRCYTKNGETVQEVDFLLP